jgi:hypothetical protein
MLSGKHGAMLAQAEPPRPPRTTDPRYWQERAEEARAMAETFSAHSAKAALLEVAKHYDYLAESTARQFACDKPIIGR